MASDGCRLIFVLGEGPNTREGCFVGPRFTGVLPSAISSTFESFVPLDQVPSQIELREASGPGSPPRRGVNGSGGRLSWNAIYGDLSGCPWFARLARRVEELSVPQEVDLCERGEWKSRSEVESSTRSQSSSSIVAWLPVPLLLGALGRFRREERSVVFPEFGFDLFLCAKRNIDARDGRRGDLCTPDWTVL